MFVHYHVLSSINKVFSFFLSFIGERTGILVKRFDHSKPQHGKDICDRILCPMKAAIGTFCNEGHDIVTANDIHTALKERLVKGTTAAVGSVDESNKNAEVKILEGFSKFHNFSFEGEGIRVWRFSETAKITVAHYQGSIFPHKCVSSP